MRAQGFDEERDSRMKPAIRSWNKNWAASGERWYRSKSRLDTAWNVLAVSISDRNRRVGACRVDQDACGVPRTGAADFKALHRVQRISWQFKDLEETMGGERESAAGGRR